MSIGVDDAAAPTLVGLVVGSSSKATAFGWGLHVYERYACVRTFVYVRCVCVWLCNRLEYTQRKTPEPFGAGVVCSPEACGQVPQFTLVSARRYD